jgi:hypothetical protein
MLSTIQVDIEPSRRRLAPISTTRLAFFQSHLLVNSTRSIPWTIHQIYGHFTRFALRNVLLVEVPLG